MNLRIGIDFDNTLAKYEKVFSKAAKELNILPIDWIGGKKELRDFIRTLDNGELLWQKLQGKVYGKFMQDAEIYPGVSEFLWKCKLSNSEVFIVSHKTIHGHFDEEKINLRTVASEWMLGNDFYKDSEFAISPNNVHYAETRSEKIQKINSLKLDYFIDDLIEVLNDEEFNLKTKKILFSNSKLDTVQNVKGIALRSWRKITNHIFGSINESDIQEILSEKWIELKFCKLTLIKANGNSRVFRVDTQRNSYILKIYPDLMIDDRKRLQAEFSGSDLLYKHGLNVPRPIFIDEKLNWGIYSWIEGEPINEYNKTLVGKLIDFVKSLKEISKASYGKFFNLASESIFSPASIESQISRRIKLLMEVDDIELQEFVFREFLPVYDKKLIEIKDFFKDNYNKDLNSSLRILSPSDFGFHNAKLDNNGEIHIFDLEYFGWDDPVKLIADFIWHPGMNLPYSLKEFWIENAIAIFPEDIEIRNRFSFYKPMIGLRWVLIILNEFLKSKLENRINADPNKSENLINIQTKQLIKAKQLLNEIKVIETR